MTNAELVIREKLHKAHQIMDDCEMYEEWGQGFEHALNWVCSALYDLDPENFDQITFKQFVYRGV